jgi:hypothetical protein
MTAHHRDELHEALRAPAAGIYSAEAAIELLISHQVFLHRSDFRDKFIHTDTSVTDNATALASIDWHDAVTALDTGNLPCSSGEGHILRLIASIADDIPVDLGSALTSLDSTNIQLLIEAIRHTSGRRPHPTP